MKEITLDDIVVLLKGSLWSEIEQSRDSIFEVYHTQKDKYLFEIKFSQGIGPIDPSYELTVKLDAHRKPTIITFDEKPWGNNGPIKQLFKEARESCRAWLHDRHNENTAMFSNFLQKEINNEPK